MNGWRSFGFDFNGEYSEDLEANDYDKVQELHRKLCIRVGKNFDLPHPGKRPTLVCMVHEADDVVTNFVLAEATMEICAGGEVALSPKEFLVMAEQIRDVARHYRIHIARAFAPKALLLKANKKPSALARLLRNAGFTQDSDEMATFFHWIQSEEGKVE